MRCWACQRYCQLPAGGTGFCQTRKNKDGKIVSLTYGLITGIQDDPIEKKPLRRFHPGARVASFGSWGCNFRCKQCLNWPTTWGGKPATIKVAPQDLVSQIKQAGFPGLAFTFNEPAISPEFVHDVAKIAKEEGLFTVMVTNGSWTKEALDYYGKYIDAANIDFKGFSEKTYRQFGGFFGQIPPMAKYAQTKYKIHLEIATLIIPTINDNLEEIKRMATWITKNLGPETPWHLVTYNPHLAPDPQFQKLPPAPTKTIQTISDIGIKAGLKHIYG